MPVDSSKFNGNCPGKYTIRLIPATRNELSLEN